MIVTPVSRLARHHGAMNRRGAAVLRQQRRMNVDEAQSRDGEHRIGQDPAVRRDDAEIGVERAQALEKRLVAQALGLQHRQSVTARRAA